MDSSTIVLKMCPVLKLFQWLWFYLILNLKARLGSPHSGLGGGGGMSLSSLVFEVSCYRLSTKSQLLLKKTSVYDQETEQQQTNQWHHQEETFEPRYM